MSRFYVKISDPSGFGGERIRYQLFVDEHAGYPTGYQNPLTCQVGDLIYICFTPYWEGIIPHDKVFILTPAEDGQLTKENYISE